MTGPCAQAVIIRIDAPNWDSEKRVVAFVVLNAHAVVATAAMSLTAFERLAWQVS